VAAQDKLAAAVHKRDMEELTHGQLERREALRTMQSAFGGGQKVVSEDGHLTLTRRGTWYVAMGSGCCYYLLRLFLRDQLGRYDWYKILQSKSDRTRLFELYILSIVNAGFISSYSIYKLAAGSNSTQGCTRMLATALGYFVHDFIAMRHEFKNDIVTPPCPETVQPLPCRVICTRAAHTVSQYTPSPSYSPSMGEYL